MQMATLLHGIEIPRAPVERLCSENGVRKLWLFGSILTDRFRSQSDVDVLVEFDPDQRPTLLTLARLQNQLTALLGRNVDLKTPGFLSRHFRDKVMTEALVLYERI